MDWGVRVFARRFVCAIVMCVLPHCLFAQESPNHGGHCTSSWSSPEQCLPNVKNEHWTDNLSVFVGLDGSKQPQDVGINAHFGGRAAINLGLPLNRDWGLGFQIGTAISATDAAVGVLEVVDGADSRTQFYSTVGLFQESESGHHWALAYDLLHQSYYDDNTLHQLRARVGTQISPCDRVGVAAMVAIGPKENAQVGGTQVRLSPIDQISAYWSHRWETNAVTECWFGFADGHGEVVHVFTGNPRRRTAPLFGSSLNIPLNDRLSIYGQGNFILPPDSGTVDAYLGLVYNFGGGNRRSVRRFAPPLDVAGSTSFAVDLAR